MNGRRPNLNQAQQDWVRQWWEALQPREPGSQRPEGALATFDRGVRARLRRYTDVDALVSERATLILADSLVQKGGGRWPLADEPEAYRHVALAAGILARVRRDTRDGRTLALHLGTDVKGGERPVMSEIRFRRLQSDQGPTDLFLQWRRAVQLVEATDVVQLADDLITWLAERNHPPGRGSDGVKFHWAYDYYVSSGDRLAARDPVSDKRS